MNELTSLGIAELAEGLAGRRFSAREVASAYLDAIRRDNPAIHAYLRTDAEGALAAAERSDQRRSRGETHGNLDGIPLAIKDNILVLGKPSSAGSKILSNYVAPYEATAVRKLREAGAVFLGKTNLDEFAMGSSTEHSAFGPTRNPRDPTRVPGGSSGGSAAAVAAGLAAAALGSDTGGSIRQPAAWCGVVGMKPTYGRVSRSGLIAMASSLDQIGPIARSVNDARRVYEAIAGRDRADATSQDAPEEIEPESDRPLRIGVPAEYFGPGLDPGVETAVRKAIAVFAKLGAEIRDITLPHAGAALAAYYIIMPAEASANLARFDAVRYGVRSPHANTLQEVYRRSRAEGLGAEPKLRIILGTFELSHGYYDAYYLTAQRVRRLIREDFMIAFRDVDLIAGPTTPAPAFPFGARSADPLQMYLEDVYTVAANLAGLPALSLPVGTVNESGVELPVGLQLHAPWFKETLLFDAAKNLESALARAVSSPAV